MNRKQTYSIVWLFIWTISLFSLHAGPKFNPCDTANAIKQELVKLTSSPIGNQSYLILQHIQNISTEDLIIKCWDTELGKLVGNTVGTLISHNAQNPEMIARIVDYLKQVREIFQRLIPLPGVFVSPIIINMMDSLVSKLRVEHNDSILTALHEKALTAAISSADALTKLKLIEQGLAQYADIQNLELSELYKRIQKIEGSSSPRSSSPPLLVYFIFVAAFSAVIVALLLLTVQLKRMKGILGENLYEVDIMSKKEKAFTDVSVTQPVTAITAIRRVGNRVHELELKLKEKPNSEDISRLIKSNTTIKQIEVDISSIKSQLNAIVKFINEIKKDFTVEKNQFQSFLQGPMIKQLDENIIRVHKIEAEMPTLPDQMIKKMVIHERHTLKKIWQEQIAENHRKGLLNLANSEWNNPQLSQISHIIETDFTFSPDFSSSFNEVLKPMRQYLQAVKVIRNTVEEFSNKKVSANPSQDLFEINQNITFLSFLQHHNEIPELLKFQKDIWLKEKFLIFVDQFLRKFQKEEFTGVLSTEMEKANLKIIEILRLFEIEPIFVELGKTPFDPKQHNGISKIYETFMNNGVIAEVIKNGFRKINGEVFIMPEVIVNRL